MATRWDDPADGIGNTAPQCVACNLYDQGRQWYFGQRLDSLKQGRSQEIMREAQRPRKYGMEELRQLCERYRREVEQLIARTPALANRPAKRSKDPRAKAGAFKANAREGKQ